MPQDIDIHIALEIISREPKGMLGQDVIADNEVVKHIIGFKQSAVVSKDIERFAYMTLVKITEILLDAIIERHVRIQVFQLLPLVYDLYHRVGLQEETVFSEEDEQQTV